MRVGLLAGPCSLEDIAEFLIIPVLLELGLVILIAVHAGITMVCHLFTKVFRLDGLVGQLCTSTALTSMRHILSHLITFISIVTKALFDIAVGLCNDLTKDDPPGTQWTHLGWILTAVMLTAIESKSSVHLVTVRVFILAFWFWTATSWLALFVFGVKWVKSKVVVKDTKSTDTDKMLTDLVNCIVMLKDRIVSLENAAAIQEKSIARLLSPGTAIIPDDLSSKKSSDCFDSDSCTEGQLTPATNDDGVLQDCSGAVSDCSEANSVQYTPNSSTTLVNTIQDRSPARHKAGILFSPAELRSDKLAPTQPTEAFKAHPSDSLARWHAWYRRFSGIHLSHFIRHTRCRHRMDRRTPRSPPFTDTPLLLSRSSDGQHFLRALRICLELQTCQTDEEWGD